MPKLLDFVLIEEPSYDQHIVEMLDSILVEGQNFSAIYSRKCRTRMATQIDHRDLSRSPPRRLYSFTHSHYGTALEQASVVVKHFLRNVSKPPSRISSSETSSSTTQPSTLMLSFTTPRARWATRMDAAASRLQRRLLHPSLVHVTCLQEESRIEVAYATC